MNRRYPPLTPPALQEFTRMASALGATAEGARTVAAMLQASYGEPARAYHTAEHVVTMLATIDSLVSAGEAVTDLTAVRLAAWFHDVVYRPGSAHNEADSAAVARDVLTGWGVEPARIASVERLIRATADHRGGRTSPAAGADVDRAVLVDSDRAVLVDADRAVLVDADLAILAAEGSRYDGYARAVRREYAGVSEARWRAGRAKFLRGMLARPNVFLTATMRRDAEGRARVNMTRELAGLGER